MDRFRRLFRRNNRENQIFQAPPVIGTIAGLPIESSTVTRLPNLNFTTLAEGALEAMREGISERFEEIARQRLQNRGIVRDSLGGTGDRIIRYIPSGTGES